MRRILLAVALVGALVGGVAAWQTITDGPPKWRTCSTEAVATPSTVTAEPTIDRSVRAEDLAEADTATNLVATPDGRALLVTTKAGLVVRVPKGGGEAEVVLDLRDVVLSTDSERGLLGIVVSPDGSSVFLHYSHTSTDFVVSEWPITAAGDIDADGERVLLREPDPDPQHNGGQLAFGPDGMLYIGMGDGGTPSDEGDAEEDAQDLTDLFGSILRVDPKPSGGRPYSIPEDNPFVDVDGARGEVFAIGLRNPWRFTIDEAAGEMWITDVGHICWEEINHVSLDDAQGANFGWRGLEGMHRYIGDIPEDHVLPVWEYRHTVAPEEALEGLPEGLPPMCGVLGGSVYRGDALPSLVGAYVYTDLCAEDVYALRANRDGVERIVLPVGIRGPTAIAEDDDGELYVLTATGVVRLVPA